MKTLFFVVILAVGGYVGFNRLPETIKTDARNYLGAINLSYLDPAKLLPPLKAKLEPLAGSLKEKIIPENPAEKRGTIIEKLASEIETIAENPSPKTAKEKQAVAKALEESRTFIQELKEENSKSGVVANTIERVANAVLPTPAASQNISSGEKPSVCPTP